MRIALTSFAQIMNQRVFGTRSFGKEVAGRLPKELTVLDCHGIEVVSGPFWDELLRRFPDLELVGAHDDLQESFDFAKLLITERPQ